MGTVIFMNSITKEENKKSGLLNGIKAGIPIGLGYLSVSFTFGIMAATYGFKWWQAVLISMTNLTSAGQFAGIGIMQASGQYIEMLITQLTINIRYSFMSISLSQKTDSRFKGIYRWIFGFFMTDEIFAVSYTQKIVTRSFFAGLTVMPYFGWTLGTLAGAVLGNILPKSLVSALGLAIYGMFIAIVIPEMKKSLAVVWTVIISMIMSSLFYYVPYLKDIGSGIKISICAVMAAAIGAVLFPQEGDERADGN